MNVSAMRRQYLKVGMTVTLLSIVLTLVLLWLFSTQHLNAKDALDHYGTPVAVAAAAGMRRVPGSGLALNSKELILNNVRLFDTVEVHRRSSVWVYTNDSRVRTYIDRVVLGQFSGRAGHFPFALSPAYRIHLITLDENGNVTRNKTEIANFLTFEVEN